MKHTKNSRKQTMESKQKLFTNKTFLTFLAANFLACYAETLDHGIILSIISDKYHNLSQGYIALSFLAVSFTIAVTVFLISRDINKHSTIYFIIGGLFICIVSFQFIEYKLCKLGIPGLFYQKNLP